MGILPLRFAQGQNDRIKGGGDSSVAYAPSELRNKKAQNDGKKRLRMIEKIIMTEEELQNRGRTI